MKINWNHVATAIIFAAAALFVVIVIVGALR